MHQPQVSVIIPLYNAEKHLHQCLDSVINQTLRDIEIICVDDGSTDRTVEILNEYQQKDERIHIYTQSNLYAGVARNTGMTYAKGKYYVFLDSDDFFEQELLEIQYAQCERHHADIGLCAGDKYNCVTGKFSSGTWFVSRKYSLIQPFSRKIYGNKIFEVTNLAPWTKIYSAAFVKRHNLCFQALPRANDVYFTMVSLALAERIVSTRKKLVHYRVGQNENLQSNNNRTPFAFCEALCLVKKRLEEENIYEKLKYGFIKNAVSQCLYNVDTLKACDNRNEILKEIRHIYIEEFNVQDLYCNRRKNKEFVALKNLLKL